MEICSRVSQLLHSLFVEHRRWPMRESLPLLSCSWGMLWNGVSIDNDHTRCLVRSYVHDNCTKRSPSGEAYWMQCWDIMGKEKETWSLLAERSLLRGTGARRWRRLPCFVIRGASFDITLKSRNKLREPSLVELYRKKWSSSTEVDTSRVSVWRRPQQTLRNRSNNEISL